MRNEYQECNCAARRHSFERRPFDQQEYDPPAASKTAITKDEIITAIKDFIKELSKNMGISANVEVRVENENVNVLLLTDNNNIMISGYVTNYLFYCLFSSIF